uniref:Phosphoinositide phospholipase C n=1 Tax=Panagrolaimus davidi TaxID=227884 RepID=A0A914QQD1_9BILA
MENYYTQKPLKYYTQNESRDIQLRIPCPQPQPHIGQPWFLEDADKEKAVEMLSRVQEDGVFLVRYSTSNHNVFVISLRGQGIIWHYQLKRNGRLFVVNDRLFESLNQVVDYYQQNAFVHGVNLNIPINESNSDQLAANNLGGLLSEYIYRLNPDKALSLKSYEGPDSNYLSFPINAEINIISKNNNYNNMWRGIYENRCGLFPPEIVKEIGSNEKMKKVDKDGYVVIKLAHADIKQIKLAKPHSIKISAPDRDWIIAADDENEAKKWFDELVKQTSSATIKEKNERKAQKIKHIDRELSKLVIYCQASHFNPNFTTETKFQEMCSLCETKHEKLIEKGLAHYNTKHLSRVYPAGMRFDSSNYLPIPMWNTGCHMVALNYQTPDLPMRLNQGKFLANGGCGYILKPKYLMDPNFDIGKLENVVGNFPINLKIEIIAGRHLYRCDQSKGICSPLVKIEIHGLGKDNETARTTSINANALNPLWQQTFEFKINFPEMALLRFHVEDGDYVGAKMDPFIGQAVFPVDCLRGGYRSVPLLNESSEPQELTTLLVHIEIEALKHQNAKVLSPHLKLQAGRTVKDPRGIIQRGRSGSNTSIQNVSQEYSYSTPLQSPTSAIPPSPRLSIQSDTGSVNSTSSNSNPEKNEMSLLKKNRKKLTYWTYMIFATFAPFTAAAFLGPFATCFIGFERCVCLLFPLKKWGIPIFIASVLTTIAAAAISLNFVVFAVLPISITSNCRVLSCLGT